jgi:5'-nucleotidase
MLLVLDTGDAWTGGGILGDLTQGEAVVDGMNLMGYDAMALGPMDLSTGRQAVADRLSEAEFPIVSANAVFSGTSDLVTDPYAIVAMGDYQVGIIGLTRVPGTPRAGFAVLDPPQALSRYVAEVEEQVDIVVLLTNLKFAAAVNLVDAVPGVDLLIAANPGQVPSRAGLTRGGTVAVTAETPFKLHTGRRVGRLLLDVGSDASLTVVDWQSRAMDRQIKDDPTMAALLQSYY